MNRFWQCLLLVVLVTAMAVGEVADNASVADNTLTAQEKKDGWKLLFDGTDPGGWTTLNGSPVEPAVQDGTLNPWACDSYILATKDKYENFVLKLDVKLTKDCNSGVFVRLFSLQPLLPERTDVGWNGIEVAVQQSDTAGYHDTGAIYDLVQPTHNNLKPLGEWNHLEVTCDRNLILVVVNGSLVTWMDTDKWTVPFKRPDGTKTKFDWLYRDFPRSGHVGLQNHGHEVWYKNIKIKELFRQTHK
jgi:hypothetical protein